jgi:polysaccharide transporter, PST family
MIYTRLRALLRHQISQNVLALSWVQVAKFVVPLVTLPYVSRVLGPSQFGLVIFAQGASIFLTLVIDWGFTPWGVRAVAASRNDPDALANILAWVRSAQLLMAAVSVPVVLGALFLVPKFNHHPAFLAMAWVAAISSGLMFNWYFTGLERLRLVAVIQLGFRVVGAALTFVLVHSPGDAWIVMALYTLPAIGMWLVTDAMAYRRLPIRLGGLRPAIVAIRDSGRLFIGTIAISLYSTFNVVLLGLFVSSVEVARFGASERIVRTWGQMVGPVAVAVYPRITFLQASGRPGRARRLWAIALAVVVGGGLVVTAVFGGFAPVLIRVIFGQKFVHEGAPIMRILVFLIPSNIVFYFAAIWLMTLHQVRTDRTLLRIVVFAGLVNVGLGTTLTLLIGARGMAVSVVTAQCVAAAQALFAVSRIRGSKALFVRRRAGDAPPASDSGVPAGTVDDARPEVPIGLEATAVDRLLE